MAEEGVQRGITAILGVDAVGYIRVTRDNEQRKILTERWTVLDWIGRAVPEAAKHMTPSQRTLRRAHANLHTIWEEI